MARDYSKVRQWENRRERFRHLGLTISQFCRNEQIATEYPRFARKHCKEQGVVSFVRPTGLVEGNKYKSRVAAAMVVRVLDMHLSVYRQTLLDMIQGLYDVNVREQGMDTDARVAHRKKFALPLLDAIKRYVASLDESKVLPTSDMEEPVVTSAIFGGRSMYRSATLRFRSITTALSS